MAKDFWIGDKVLLRSSKRIGVYQGKSKDGRAKIKIENKIIITNESNVEIIPENEQYFDIDTFLTLEKDQEIVSENQKLPKKVKLHHTLDLHIEVLAPEMKHLPSGQILNFQVEKCKAFIEQNLQQGTSHITIIHGKGQGVLKSAIEAALKEFHQIKLTSTKNNGGALDVWF
ncbi:MAG: Smr/MutS family protein [Saprospiraceae bacterium]